MVICQVIDKLKLVFLFAAQHLTGSVKMTVTFFSYGLLALAERERERESLCVSFYKQLLKTFILSPRIYAGEYNVAI